MRLVGLNKSIDTGHLFELWYHDHDGDDPEAAAPGTPWANTSLVGNVLLMIARSANTSPVLSGRVMTHSMSGVK